MIIIEQNLSGLVTQQNICAQTLVEEFCLTVRLGEEIFKPKMHDSAGKIKNVVFNHIPDPSDLFHPMTRIEQNLELGPGEMVIACSHDVYSMPKNYFGLLQTKGTLARLFVSITCNDGQIEPGFRGRITLEITNHSPWAITLPLLSAIGQLYLVRCSSSAKSGYSGRYAEKAQLGPTIPIWKR